MHRIVIGCDTKKVYNHKEYLYLRKIKYSQLTTEKAFTWLGIEIYWRQETSLYSWETALTCLLLLGVCMNNKECGRDQNCAQP